MPKPKFFFDSHGTLWVTCSPSHPEACAFGPTMFSRPAQPTEAGLNVTAEQTIYSAAREADRVIFPEEDTGWFLLRD